MNRIPTARRDRGCGEDDAGPHGGADVHDAAFAGDAAVTGGATGRAAIDDGPAGVDRASDNAGDIERMQQGLLKLPPRYQAVLSLHYLEGLSVEETAAVLGCRNGTVKSRLSRARDALRALLMNRPE